MNSQQQDLLAVVSHELRTPLGAIAGWVRLLRSEKLDTAKSAYAFSVIEQSIKAQAALIDDLTDVSRIINGDFRLQIEEVDVPAILKLAVDTVQPVAEEKQIRIFIAPLSEMPGIAADPARLQQVLTNLLSNAIKFTPRGGSVWTELNCNDSDLEISVTDTGQGIDPEFLPFVFERFRQGENVTNGRKAGLGLGLAIVREIIELHSGTVSAYSEGKGKGATFIVRLPAQSMSRDCPTAHPDGRELATDRILKSCSAPNGGLRDQEYVDLLRSHFRDPIGKS